MKGGEETGREIIREKGVPNLEREERSIEEGR